MQVLFLLLVIMSAASAIAQVHDVHYQGNLTPLNTTPTFDHGYLVVYDRDHRVDVFASDGALIYSVAAQVPGSDWANIENGAVDSDGTMAAAIRAVSASGIARGGGIAIFDRTGAQIRFLDTGDYLPAQVAFGPDHSIWTIGWLGYHTASLTADYSTLRNYAQDGRELGKFLPRASFPYSQYPGGEPLILPMLGLWELRVANERVEALLHRAHLWVQTDLNGQEKGRWDTGPNGRPSAITQSGKAWRKDEHQLKVFDRSAGVWHAVAFDAPEGTLLGAEGNSLVFLLRGQNTLRWVPAPGESPAPDLLGGNRLSRNCPRARVVRTLGHWLCRYPRSARVGSLLASRLVFINRQGRAARLLSDAPRELLSPGVSEARRLITLEMRIVSREEQTFQAICFVEDATWNPFPFKSQRLG